MKIKLNQHLLLSLTFLVLLLTACGEEEKNNRVDNTNSLNTTTQTQTNPTPPADFQAPPEVRDENGNIVYHYLCPDNCAGGGSNINGNCSVCGKKLAHNDLYHNYQQQNTPPPPPAGMNQAAGAAGQNLTPPPGQNANGVWHYTCPNGCEGGSGSQGTCVTCGAALTHNQAYHN